MPLIRNGGGGGGRVTFTPTNKYNQKGFIAWDL